MFSKLDKQTFMSVCLIHIVLFHMSKILHKLLHVACGYTSFLQGTHTMYRQVSVRESQRQLRCIYTRSDCTDFVWIASSSFSYLILWMSMQILMTNTPLTCCLHLDVHLSRMPPTWGMWSCFFLACQPHSLCGIPAEGYLHPVYFRYYLPTPPLGQDMTQGQFLSGV